MIILDADSLMSGDTLVRLTHAMETRPEAGLIQTAPVVVNARSLIRAPCSNSPDGSTDRW